MHITLQYVLHTNRPTPLTAWPVLGVSSAITGTSRFQSRSVTNGYSRLSIRPTSVTFIRIRCAFRYPNSYLTRTISDFFTFIFRFTFFSPGALSKSQFPVFTIYAQKTCLGIKPCERAWCFDRVQGYKLKGFSKKKQPAASRQDCLELCLGEREFSCR